jgi:cation:H+ antiporter
MARGPVGSSGTPQPPAAGHGSSGSEALIHWLSLIGISALPVLWLAAHGLHWLGEAPLPTAVFSGLGIFGAAFLLSWAADVAQLDIPRALALAMLALVAVLPEYAVDVYFAWRAGQDPTYTAYATANMTGANRLLIGLGWVLPMFAYALRYRRTEVLLPRDEAVEVKYLALAAAYCFLLPLKGTIAVYDTAVLFAIYFFYARAAARCHHEEPELEGPALTIAALGPIGRRVVVLLLFALAGTAILTAAEPFAESLVATGRTLGIDEFLLVQWLAPLASESPEFIVAMLFALRGAAAGAMAIMISSGVNQFTLLIGALPAAFSLSAGEIGAMQLDERQTVEVFLTAAQAVFAVSVIADFRITLKEAGLLFVLFAPQFVPAFTSDQARFIHAIVFLVMAAAWWALRWLRPGRAGAQLRQGT